MEKITNDIPDVYLALAKEAIAVGMEKVCIGFMDLDVEFVSPIEWSIQLAKQEYGEKDSFVHASGDRSVPPRGYRGTSALLTRMAGKATPVYWDAETIEEWIGLPTTAESSDRDIWIAETGDAMRANNLYLWRLFELGVRNGWNMTLVQRNVYPKEYMISRGLTQKKQFTLTWETHNRFYNVKGHPDHHSTGAPITRGGSYSHLEDKGFFSSADGEAIQSLEELESCLSSPSPWFVRVVTEDEDGEWMHFPEALKAPEETVAAANC